MSATYARQISIRGRQHGSASVEAILVLPFVLVLAVLAVYTTHLMLLKRENQNEARLAAWRQSTFSAVCLSLGRQMGHGELMNRYCSSDQQPATELLDTLERKGNHRKRAQALVQTIRESGIPGAVVATSRASRSFGRPETPAEYWTRIAVINRYGVDAMRMWQRRDLPIGYDGYLNKVLDSKIIFSGYFPNVR